jgi:hypothetical protein
MPNISDRFQTPMPHLNDRLDRLLFSLATYALPVIIGLLSLIALFVWPSQYPLTNPKPLSFRVITQTEASLEPEQALVRLNNQPLVSLYDTRLSGYHFWPGLKKAASRRWWSFLRDTR